MFGQMIGAQDEREIRFLLGHYVHLLDAGDGSGWAGLFTEDGRWIRRNAAPAALGGSGIAPGERRGRADLTELAEFSVRNFRGLCRHQMTDIVLWQGADAQTVQGRSRMLISDFREGPGHIAMAGIYDMTFVHSSERWRIAVLSAEFLPR